MGYARLDITFLFFFQGVLLGGLGSILGLFLGYLLSLYLSTLPGFSSPLMSTPSQFLISFNPAIYFQSFTFGITSSAIAALLPAHHAGKLSPIEIIRSGADS